MTAHFYERHQDGVVKFGIEFDSNEELGAFLLGRGLNPAQCAPMRSSSDCQDSGVGNPTSSKRGRRSHDATIAEAVDSIGAAVIDTGLSLSTRSRMVVAKINESGVGDVPCERTVANYLRRIGKNSGKKCGNKSTVARVAS